MAEEAKIPDVFRAYEEGKHRRYTLLFAVNGGAFAVVQWFLGTADSKPKEVDPIPAFLEILTVYNTFFLGALQSWQLSFGMALFTTVMVVDIFLFGQNMRKKTPELGLFSRQGKLVLILIGALICAGWTLVSFGYRGLPLVIVGYLVIIAVVWIQTRDMAEGLQKKNLQTSPDETRTLGRGEMKTATFGDFKVAREWLEPGWKWSEDIKPIVGTDSCQFQHYGVLLSGRMKVVADDGSQMEVGPGDAYVIPPGHDAWIVGDEPASGIELSPEAVERFAKG